MIYALLFLILWYALAKWCGSLGMFKEDREILEEDNAKYKSKKYASTK